MKRTRLIFFLVLAVCLVILAASLARHLLSATALLPIFVACTVFGAGVVLLDFAGVLGHHVDDALAGLGGHGLAGGGHDFAGHGGDAGHDLSAAHSAAGAAHAAAEGGHAHPVAAAEAGHHPAPASEPRDQGNGQAPAATGEHPPLVTADHAPLVTAGHVPLVTAGHVPLVTAGHVPLVTAGHLPGHPAVVTHPGPDVTPVLSLLAYLRLLVYFCLGFGPAGWVALASGESPLAGLGIAVPFGLASVWLARAFFRFQRHDTGAVPPETDLMAEQAQVVIPLDHTTMGKVRVAAGMTVTDLYALAADPEAHFKEGDTVRVVSVTDQCVFVR